MLNFILKMTMLQSILFENAELQELFEPLLKADFPKWYEVYEKLRDLKVDSLSLIKNISMVEYKPFVAQLFRTAEQEIIHVNGQVSGFVYSENDSLKKTLEDSFDRNPDFAYRLLFGPVALSHYEGNNPHPHDYLEFLFELKEKVEERNQQEGTKGIVSVISAELDPLFHFLAIDQGKSVGCEMPHFSWDGLRDRFEFSDSAAYQVVKDFYNSEAAKTGVRVLFSMKNVNSASLDYFLNKES